MDHGAQGEFRFCVATADVAHDLRALLRGEDVHGEINAEKVKTEGLEDTNDAVFLIAETCLADRIWPQSLCPNPFHTMRVQSL